MDQKILVLGAGRSATSLINYLLEHAPADRFRVVVTDLDFALARNKVGEHKHGTAGQLNIENQEELRKLIMECSVVISMLPPPLHYSVAIHCLDLGRHLLTASYLSEDIRKLDHQVRKKKLLFMTEMGLDPGIDHMSAMKLITEIKEKSGQIASFSSYTGGLISRESDDNPWHYKITWNPRNIVLAGNKTARFRSDGKEKFVSYGQIFRNVKVIEVPGHGSFEMYPNRDSISYADIYGLSDIKSIVRGTFRHVGFCSAWAVVVALGLTDMDTAVNGSHFQTYRDLLSAFLPEGKQSLEEKIKMSDCMATDEVIDQILWLFDDSPVPPKQGTVADLMEHLLLQKWSLQENDKDLVVMHHQITYTLEGEELQAQSSMVMQGKDKNQTAMANLVGLPLGICARQILQGQINLIGVHRPIDPDIFLPILSELEHYGVLFTEKSTVRK